MEVAVKISSQYNNCSFHTVVPELVKNLSSNRLKKTKGYQYFRKAFAKYYYLQDNQELNRRITSICSMFSNPLDQQVLLGPVLRLTLKSVLSNDKQYKKLARESFKGLIDRCKREYNKNFSGENTNINNLINVLSELKFDGDEQEPLFKTNVKFIAEHILNKRKTITDVEWEKAYDAYVDYVGDPGGCSYVSFDELTLLCNSFNFECENAEYAVEEDLELESESESESEIDGPIATICVKNPTGVHWELADGDLIASSKSVFNEYHEMSCYVQSLGVSSDYLNNLQNLFRKKISQVILEKQKYDEEAYTVLPRHKWGAISGFSPLVDILCQEITGEKTFVRKISGNETEDLQDTVAMAEFVLAYCEYYELEENMTMPELLSELKKLLCDYPLSKERLMIIGPVLEAMGSLPAVYKKFGIALEIYMSRSDSKKAHYYDRVTPFYEDKAKYFASAGVRQDGKSYQALNLEESNELALSLVIAEHSPTQAFNFNQKMTVAKQRELVKKGIKQYHDTGVLYCFGGKRSSTKLQLVKPSSLHKAIESDKVDLVKNAIDSGVDWRKVVMWSSSNQSEKYKILPKSMNALELAAYYGNRAIITLLLDHINGEKEKKHIESAYNIACGFSELNVLVPFLRYSWLQNSPRALFKAITSKDLALFEKLGTSEGKEKFVFQNQDRLLAISFSEYGRSKDYSFSLMGVLLYFKCQKPSELALNEKAISILEKAFQQEAEEWGKYFLNALEKFTLEIKKKGSIEEEIVIENDKKITEVLAKAACHAIEDKNAKKLKNCIEASERCLSFPGEHNPLHYGFDNGKYGFVKSVYAKSCASTKEAQLRLKEMSKFTYDKLERSLEFKIDRLDYRNDLDRKIATTDSLVEQAKLRAAKLKFHLGSAIYEMGYRYHEKTLHQEKIHRLPLYRKGHLGTLLVRGLGTLSSEGPIRYGLNFAMSYVPTLIQEPIRYFTSDLCGGLASSVGLDPVTGKRYLPNLVQNGILCFAFPEYFLVSTAFDLAVYTAAYGRGYDNVEALAYLGSNALANTLTEVKTNYEIDERYTYRLTNNLKPFFGEAITPYLVLGVSGIDSVSLQMQQIVQKSFSQAGDFLSQHALNQSVFSFDFSPFETEFSSLITRFKAGTETIQSYQNRLRQFQGEILNYIESAVLQQMGDSVFKKERLHVIKAFEVYQLQMTGLSIEEQLAGAKKQEDPILISSLEQELAAHNQLLDAAKAEEQHLFEQTEGYEYYNDWLQKFSEFKFGEYDPSNTATPLEVLRQAEIEAENKAKFYNSNLINASMESHKKFFNELFELKKDNFMVHHSEAKKIDDLIDAGFLNYSDRVELAKYLANIIIRYKYPLYPECGDAAAIEQEKEEYVQEISTYKLSGFRSDEGRAKRRLYDYLYAKLTGTPEKRRISRTRDIFQTVVNEFTKEVGFTIYKDRKNSIQRGGRAGSIGIDASYGAGQGTSIHATVSGQPVIRLYTNQPVVSINVDRSIGPPNSVQPAIATQVDMKSSMLINLATSEVERSSSGMSIENPYIQNALNVQFEKTFGEALQRHESDKKRVVVQSELPKAQTKAESSTRVTRSMSQQPSHDHDYTTKEKVLIGIGRAAVRTGQGIKQLGLEAGEKLKLVKKGATAEYTAKINEEAEFYEQTAVGKSRAGKVGEVVGDIAASLAVPGGAGVRGAKLIASAAASGGVLGGLQPTKDGTLKSRLRNAATGAAEGAVGATVLNKAAKVVSPLFNKTKATNSVKSFDTKAIEVKKPSGGKGVAGGTTPFYNLRSKEISKANQAITINGSSPAEIFYGYGELTKRQNEMLKKLPESDTMVTIHKKNFNVNDLAALTAKTGDEFAMFTLGSQKIIARGNFREVYLNPNLFEKLKVEGWRWSAHTHVGAKDLTLNASGNTGDRGILEILSQERSLILNSAGRRNVFDKEHDLHLTSSQVKSSLKTTSSKKLKNR